MEKNVIATKMEKLKWLDDLMSRKLKHQLCIARLREFVEEKTTDKLGYSEMEFDRNDYYGVSSTISVSLFEDQYQYAEFIIGEVENRLMVLNKAIERAEKDYMDTINVSVTC